MDTFDFPYHSLTWQYPDSSPNIQLGRSYIFASRPIGPPQRKMVLNFKAMKIFTNTDGTIDLTSTPQYNFMVLDAFYKAHETYKIFLYPHQIEGNREVRFAMPLAMPKITESVGGFGVTEAFEVNLIEVL